jgi:hypothetical protein
MCIGNKFPKTKEHKPNQQWHRTGPAFGVHLMPFEVFRCSIRSVRVAVARPGARGVGRLENISFWGAELVMWFVGGLFRQSGISELLAGPVAKRSSPVNSMNGAAPCGTAQVAFLVQKCKVGGCFEACG